MFEIEIDGKLVNAEAGEKLIEVTDRVGISVPRFCYHEKLSVAANCRMCLVDVEGAPKPQPACSTPVSEGMKVSTQNEKAKSAQKSVMEFLLINHPLDCPICDQGGECELQDVAMSYGSNVSRFNEGKRVIADSNIGALIHTDMTRCIHCTRCVRFGTEIAGIMEMGGTGRGESLKIEPFLNEGIQSELSGNMIDVCPVGALTSKPFRYELRSWQMNSTESIARHDLVGSNINVQTYKGKVKRIVARSNDSVNETWISDRDRFSYEGLSHSNRLLKPQVKFDGTWKEVSWEVALDFCVKGLLRSAGESNSMNSLGVLASKTATLEEYYLLQKLVSELGCENIDYRLGVKDTKNTINLESNVKLSDLEKIDHALIVGSYTRLEQPMINHRLRKAALRGGTVDVINSMQFDFNLALNNENIIIPCEIANLLASTLKVVLESTNQDVPEELNKLTITKSATKIAKKLLSSDASVIVLGEHVINNDNAKNISNLVAMLAKNTNSSTLNLSKTGNSIAADIAGFFPGKDGLDVNSMLGKDMNAYIMFDVYPEYDFHNSSTAIKALSDKNSFIVSMNSFYNNNVADYSDVMLPISSYYETSGTHVNIEGEFQTFAASVKAPQESKPAWKVIKVLADLLDISGFNYSDSSNVLEEAKHNIKQGHRAEESINITDTNSVEVIWQPSPYSIDALLRHSDSLQETKIGQINKATMNSSTAKHLNLGDKDDYLGVPVVISSLVANNCVFINANKSTPSEEQA
ncbi:MAG TPA: NADH-quinone oxidoreductase subunit G [Gammaproteobacteria bacterium]|nr:NADH-quinone oxidoreductase subunit G [Gammaproteobacteria bacterium]